MKVVEFTETAKHEKLTFLKGGVYGYEDEDVANYVVAAGWAEPSDKEPQHIFGEDEISIDPENTRHNASGLQMADIMKHGTVDEAKAAGVEPRTSQPIGELEVQDVVSPAPAEEK